jgi:hypothetical protein
VNDDEPVAVSAITDTAPSKNARKTDMPAKPRLSVIVFLLVSGAEKSAYYL